MATRLADPREIDAMTADQADELFAELAQAQIRAWKIQAAAEKKIADIKAKCQDDAAEDLKAVKDREARLTSYILAHRERFARPRQRQTPYGKYGLRTATKLEVADEDALIDLSNENGLGLTAVAVKIDKAAVSRAIADGIDLKGLAQIVSGDTASYDVDKKLLNS